MKTLAALVLALFCSTSALACDKAAARKVQSMLREMASWSEKEDRITFRWGSDWDQTASHQRLGLVRAFADSDACLTGRAREVNFYRMGKLVGKASPTTGIRLVE